ncbi:hypothetical protein V6N11_029323 [Hibiscus sabdariffa]|uniref:Uncharacterized protein n=2 Tax=Hibiscus sabdariffa TaxID=183260 RepID=A0ABR2CLG5_9ROSI
MPKRKPTGSPATDDPPHLQPGSQIEISSNDPGFRGSWYTGVIIKRAPSKKPANKFVVEYTHLFEDDAGTKPLRETIDAVDLRPPAPREKLRKFKFSEEVDAFYNDGWWEGVITKELENGRFHVYFKRSKEQLEFGDDQLRLHREWIKEAWTPPLEEDKQAKESDGAATQVKMENNKVVARGKLEHDDTASKKKLKTDLATSGGKLESSKITKYREGERVEVTSDEDGFEGAWFTGTIVKAVGKDKYLCQYDSLRTDDDNDFLKEEFDALHIRPCPPEIVMADAFQKLDEVDAFYNDGWWVGVISKVLNSLPEMKYEVYFKATQEEMKFKHSELRIHQDWINGKWVTPSKALKS